MAEVNTGKNGSKQRRDSQRRGKGRKTPETVEKTVSNDDELKCNACEIVFIYPSDQLLECERCDKWFCTGCIGMSDAVYKVMTERKDMHWYCSECEASAVAAVKTDKDIEDKCAQYMKTFSERLDNIDKKLESKADKSSPTDLENRVKKVESMKKSDKGASDSNDTGSETQNTDTVRKTIEEQKERDFRAKNIIIHNIPESQKADIEERRQEDIELVTDLLVTLGVDQENAIEWCSRIGKKETGKKRITKVTLESIQLKREILKKSRSLKDMDGYEETYVGPDLTQMQRKEQYMLRKELNERKDKGEKNIFISRGKIIQARERALQFKGGAATTQK